MQPSDDWDSHWRSLEPVTKQIPSQAFRHRLVIRYVINAKPKTIIDIGCGQGDLLYELSRHFNADALAGLELSTTGVKEALRKVPQADIHQFDLLSADPSPLPSDFDCLTCVEVLEHVDDPIRFLSSALLQLAPGGKVVITVPSGPRTAFDKSIGHRRHFNKKELLTVLNSTGLVNAQIRRVGFPFFDIYRFVVLLTGKRLASTVADSSLDKSKIARFVMFTFSILLRVNPNFIPLGLQLIATADFAPQVKSDEFTNSSRCS
jgi:2-polyprenyl-3-methyl-5-hydroxy-6-metoxy-1,4-benzoquinol methylase